MNKGIPSLLRPGEEKEWEEYEKLYHSKYPYGGPSWSFPSCSGKKKIIRDKCGCWKCHFDEIKI